VKPTIDPYLEKLETTDKKIYQKLLQTMVKYSELHAALAQHSTTPTEILQKIADHYELAKLPTQLIANPNCPRKILQQAMKELPESLLHALASNENLTREDLATLISYPELAEILASRNNLPADYFVYLWENYLVDKKDSLTGINLSLLRALAWNPSTPLKVLKNLAKYELLNSPNEVESLLMSNPSLPEIDRAQYALMGITAAENGLLDESVWPLSYPSDLVFEIVDFHEDLLLALAEVGHPAGLLRTDYIPNSIDELDSTLMFNFWLDNQSIYKTLWPELREKNQEEAETIQFTHATGDRIAVERVYFFYNGIELEHHHEGDYHAIADLPDWITSSPDLSEAIDDFTWRDFDIAVGEDGIEFTQAWCLANVDLDYISLTDKAYDFIKHQYRISQGDGNERFFPAEIVDSKIGAYSWKKLSDAKKELLIAFIKRVYLEQEDDFYQLAEHYLLCIYLNPHTPRNLIEKYLLDIDSEVLKQAEALKSL
jgi:hypothetical protein